MGKLKYIGKYAYYFFIVFIVVLVLNNVVVRSDKLFDLVGIRMYTVLTGSMEPEIKPGDLAIVKAIDVDSLDINDVITFRYGEYVVTHRIVDKEEGGFITKGDNNNVEDKEIIYENDVIGKVITTIPKLGHLMAFLAKPIVIAVSLMLVALLIIKESFSDDNDKNVESEKRM